MEDQIKCTKCGSTQITAQKKGFSVGKAAAGVILTGGIGLAAGAIGSGTVLVTCLKCGNNWDPKKLYKEEHKQQRPNGQVGIDAKQNAELDKRYKAWKLNFYSAYDGGHFDKAEIIYKQKRSFEYKITNVHEGYKSLKVIDKKQTKQSIIAGLIVLVVIALIIYAFS
jgi:predicted nucleic-acid-binding Zn-ribbon protein